MPNVPCDTVPTRSPRQYRDHSCITSGVIIMSLGMLALSFQQPTRQPSRPAAREPVVIHRLAIALRHPRRSRNPRFNHYRAAIQLSP